MPQQETIMDYGLALQNVHPYQDIHLWGPPLSYHTADIPNTSVQCDEPPMTYLEDSLSTNPPHPQYSRPCSQGPRPKKTATRISRPPNAFLLFRSHLWACEKQKPNPVERDHRDISRIASHCWRNLDQATKQVFHDRALRLRELHQQQHPEYKYTPARKARSAKKAVRPTEDDERCARLASMIMPDVVQSTRVCTNDSEIRVASKAASTQVQLMHPTPRRPEPVERVLPTFFDEQPAAQYQTPNHDYVTTGMGSESLGITFPQVTPPVVHPFMLAMDMEETLMYQVYGFRSNELQYPSFTTVPESYF